MSKRILGLRSGHAIHSVILLGVVLAAGYFRFVGLNWDELHHLHPDERFLTMVETGIRPVSGGWKEYFDTANSTLNPHNRGYGFFVYGTAPIFAVRYLAQFISDTGFQLSEWGIKSTLVLGTGYDQVHLVGRVVSALADTISVLLIYFLGRRLYNGTVGLLASALAAMTVALIQQAHYFTVDSVANLFALIGLLFAVRAMYSYSVVNYVGFGVGVGLAVASRINLAPLGLVIVLSEVCRSSRVDLRGSTAVRIGIALGASLLVFRVAQPYAFEGPSMFDVGLNEQWIGNILEVRGQMSGNVDFPPNHQWAHRAALVFPMRNMVLWGMGPALGICAWSGFCVALWRVLRKEGEYTRHLLPVVWVGVYFLWQGMQWVKPIRYFLPIYPCLILLGAWLLYELAVKGRARGIMRWPSVAAVGLVLVASAIYAIGFTGIYTRPVTRVEASRWIFENVAGPFSLFIQNSGEIVKQPVPMPVGVRFERGGVRHTEKFTARFSGVLTGVEIGHLSELVPDSDTESFLVEIWKDGAEKKHSEAILTADLASDSGYILNVNPPLYVTEGEDYQLVSQVLSGEGLMISGARLVNESSWDDGLPLRMNGYDGFGGIYQGYNLELYWADDESKRARMLDILDRADYILISSNRQYGSIPRLPTRYPLTSTYYNALFSGELGFQLEKTFESSPSIGSWSVSDQSAEEPFTVYDHPKVMIYRKTPEFSIERVETIFNKVDLSQVVWMDPKNATAAPNGLFLPEDRLVEQRKGGTWSDMFDRTSVLNNQHWLGALAWWCAILILGWIVYPLAWTTFGGLTDRGYAVAKILALLSVSWTTWILASMRWMPFSRGTIALAIIFLALVSTAIIWGRVSEYRQWIASRARYIIGIEAVWLFLFLFLLFVRWSNPDLWHPNYGGEKPMNFAYLNAVIRSTSFPPYDPWMAGGYINYYYFGYVMAAVPTKLLGIVPSVAYNLLLPMLFAMTGSGAFCVAYNLLKYQQREASRRHDKTYPILGGLAAGTMMVLVGNLGQIDTILKAIRNSSVVTSAGMLDASLSKWFVMLRDFISQPGMSNIGRGEWYWNATRIIPHSVGEAGPITEFPLFTFLYADLHAHMLALPLTLLAISWCVCLVLGAKQSLRMDENILLFCVGGITIGSLAATNTWDFPVYMALGCMAVVWGHLRFCNKLDYAFLLGASARVVALIALGTLLYQPYAKWFGSGYNRIELWSGSMTPLHSFLKIHGLFLFVIVTFMIAESRKLFRSGLAGNSYENQARHYAVLLGGVALAIMGILLFVRGVQIAPLVLGLVALGSLLLIYLPENASIKIVITIVILALVLTLIVEVLRLSGDIGRMNTVFKFYFQAWTLLSIASGVAVVWAYERVKKWGRRSGAIWNLGVVVLMAIASSYTLLATLAKIADRIDPRAGPGLDGMAFMETSQYHDNGQVVELGPDYDAIIWLQENVVGSPVIVEAHAPEYKYGSRYSIYTGLPGVVGWNWHQRQQRAITPGNLITDRVEATDRFYREEDIQQAMEFVLRYDVKYVVVGGYERVYYPYSGLEKFGRMVELGMLEVAYDNGEVVVYVHEPVSNGTGGL